MLMNRFAPVYRPCGVGNLHTFTIQAVERGPSDQFNFKFQASQRHASNPVARVLEKRTGTKVANPKPSEKHIEKTMATFFWFAMKSSS